MATTGSFQTLYTVPSGRVAVVKTVAVRNASGVSSTLNIAFPGPQTIHTFGPLAAAGEGEWDTWCVLNAADTILGFIDHQPWNIFISGYLLTVV